MSFHSAIEGAEARAKAEGRRDIALAHTSALFWRASKLEPLEHYLPVDRPEASGSMLDRLKAVAERTKDL